MASTTAIIDHDLPCVGCGYNLRTLSHAGRCPECGNPVAKSLSGHRLHDVDPTWCRNTACGLLFMSWVLITFILFNAYLSVFMFFVHANNNFMFDALPYVILGINLPAHIAFAIGIWRITHPDPRNPQRDRWLRLGARSIALVLLTATIHETADYTWALLPQNIQNTLQQKVFLITIPIDLSSVVSWMLSMGWPSILFAITSQLWRWFDRSAQLGRRRLVSIGLWLLLGVALAAVTELVTIEFLYNPTDETSAWWDLFGEMIRWSRFAYSLLSISVLIILVRSTRAAAMTMQRSSTDVLTRSEPE